MVVKFKNTKLYLYKYSKKLIKLLQIELGRNRNRRTASGSSVSAPINSEGKLSESLAVKLKETADRFSFDISGNSYGLNVNDGRKKGSAPPVSEIISWIKAKPVRLRDSKGRFITRNDITINRIAHSISRSIELNGITATNFIDDAIEKSMEDLNTIGNAVGEDVMLNVDDILLKAGYIKKGENYTIKTE